MNGKTKRIGMLNKMGVAGRLVVAFGKKSVRKSERPRVEMRIRRVLVGMLGKSSLPKKYSDFCSEVSVDAESFRFRRLGIRFSNARSNVNDRPGSSFLPTTYQNRLGIRNSRSIGSVLGNGARKAAKINQVRRVILYHFGGCKTFGVYYSTKLIALGNQ